MDAPPESETAAAPEPPAAIDPRPRAAADPDARGAAALHAPVIGPAIRTWLRHAVPLTLLSAIALSPLIALALRIPAPADPAGAKSALALGWTLLGVAWLGQLLLVGGASAMIDSPGSQLRALAAGLLQLGRAIVPCLVAAAAIAIAGLALVVPGVVVLVLLSLTAASRERGVPAPLLDSIAAARRQLPAVALAVAALLAIDAAIGLVAHRALIAALPARPAPAQLAATRAFARAIVVALVVVSPLPATVLAVLRARDPSPGPAERAP